MPRSRRSRHHRARRRRRTARRRTDPTSSARAAWSSDHSASPARPAPESVVVVVVLSLAGVVVLVVLSLAGVVVLVVLSLAGVVVLVVSLAGVVRRRRVARGSGASTSCHSPARTTWSCPARIVDHRERDLRGRERNDHRERSARPDLLPVQSPAQSATSRAREDDEEERRTEVPAMIPLPCSFHSELPARSV